MDRETLIWCGEGDFCERGTSKLNGLGIVPEAAMELNIRGLVELLTIPCQFRQTDPYQAKLIKLVNSEDIRTIIQTAMISVGRTFTKLTVG